MQETTIVLCTAVSRNIFTLAASTIIVLFPSEFALLLHILQVRLVLQLYNTFTTALTLILALILVSFSWAAASSALAAARAFLLGSTSQNTS